MASPTGLSQLGNVLLQGSGDYANMRLRREAEERARAQQLADLQDQRQFVTGQRDVERGFSLEDEARRRQQGVDDATLQILLKEGWLKPTDVRNPDAIHDAADARQAQLSQVRTRESALPKKLQEEADYLGSQDVELSAVESSLNRTLMEPEPGPPSQAEVRRLAMRMTNKPVPSEQEINDMLPAATDAIMKERLTRWMMNKEDARTQIPLLRSQRTALRQSLSGLLQQGFVPNRPPPSPMQTLGSPAPALRPASAAEAAAAAGGSAPPPVSAPPPAATPTEYGGIRGALPRMGTLQALLSDPVGAAEVGFRSSVLPVAGRNIDMLLGGERQAAEGDAARAKSLQDAVQRFQAPSRPFQANPFWSGNYMPVLPPLKPLPPRSPALQFAPGY